MMCRTNAPASKIGYAVMLVAGILLCSSIFAFSRLLGSVLENRVPVGDRLKIFYRLFPYYLAFEVISRLFIQKLPGIPLMFYLTENIRKSSLAIYLFIGSFFNVSNLIALLVFSSFLLPYFFGGRPVLSVLFWPIIVSINCLVMMVKFSGYQGLPGNVLAAVVMAGSVLVCVVPWCMKLLSRLAEMIFTGSESLLVLPALAVAIMLFALCFIRKMFYQESPPAAAAGGWLSRQIPQNGITAWLMLEIKLITRSARVRKIIWSSLVYQLCSIYFITLSQGDRFSLLIFSLAGLGILPLSYGQYAYSWHSGHIGLIFSKKIRVCAFLKAKFLLLSGASLLAFLPGVIAFWNDGPLLRDYLFCLVYCVGIIPFSCLAFGTHNYRGINISAKGLLANWEGLGLTQVLTGVPFFLFPVVSWFIGKYLGNSGLVFRVMAALGLLMVFTKRLWINCLAKKIRLKKYQMFEGFTSGINQSNFRQ